MNTETLHETKRFSYREGKQRLRSVRWMLFSIAAVQTAVTALMAVISSFFAEPLPFYLQVLIIELLAYLLPLGVYTRTNRLFTLQEARQRLGLKNCKSCFWLLVILAGIGCQFVMIILNLPLNFLLPEEAAPIPANPGELLAALFVVAIVPAVCEEYLFRGIVYGVMKEFNTLAAVIFTAVMFAFLHGSVTGFFGYLFLGLGSSFLLRRTGSLYASIVFHLINNITALLLSYYSGALLYAPAATLWMFLTGVLAIAIAFAGIWRLTCPDKPVRVMKASDLLGQSFMNLPIILCIFCMIGVLILR